MALKAWTVVGVVNVDGMRTALGKLKTFKGAGRAAAKVWQRAWGLAKTAMVAWTAAMGAATAATVGFAAKTERQFSELAKLTNETIGSEIGRAVQRMGEDLPVARDQLFETAEAALRLGVRGTENVKEFTKVIGKVGVATDIAAGNAAEIMARFSAATETPISKVRNLASVVNELSNTLPRSFSQILQAAQRAGPQLARLGANATQISTLSGVLTSVSASAQRAGTRLRRLGQELTEPDKVNALHKAFKQMGVDGFRSIIQNNPTKAIVMMARAMRRGNSAATAITETLASSSRQALAGLAQRLPRLTDELGRMSDEFKRGTSLQEEFSKFQGDLISQWETLKTTLINTAASIGEHLLPVFKDLVQFVENNAAQIGVAVAEGLAKTLDLMITTIDAIKGHVKAIGIGGIIGFLFFGPAGAAIGGLIGKVISENAARLKRFANQFINTFTWPFKIKPFEITPGEETAMQLSDAQGQLSKIVRLTEKLESGEPLSMADASALRRLGIEDIGEKTRQDIIRQLSVRAANLGNEIKSLQSAASNMFDAGFKVPGQETNTLLDKLLNKLRAARNELERMTEEDAGVFTGDEGLKDVDIRRPSVRAMNAPGTPRGTFITRFRQGLRLPGEMSSLNIMPQRFRPGRRTQPLPAFSAASTSQRIQRGTRLGGQIGGTGLEDAGSATGQGLLEASTKGLRLSAPEFEKAFVDVLEDTSDNAEQRGFGLMRRLGQQLMAGLASGTFDMKDFIKRAFFQVLQLALFSQSGLLGSLGIASPAKSTKPIGANLVRGIGEGVKSQQSNLRRTMRGIKGVALGEMSGLGTEARRRIAAGGGSVPAGGGGLPPIQINVPTESMPEPQNPPQEEYRQRTRVWMEKWGRRLREEGVPEFQPPEDKV